MDRDDEKVIYLWEIFEEWAEADGIGLEYEEDWQPWWKCWMAAMDAHAMQG